ESREHVSAMNHWLLQLERGAGGPEPVSAIFRAVHTIKGMSATMGYTAVAELSHELETLLDRVRRHERAVTPDVMEVLFRSADALEASIEAAVRGQRPPLALSQLILQLRSIAGPGEKEAPREEALSPRPGLSRAESEVPGGWTAALEPGRGMAVRIRLAPETPLRGVRAFMIVQSLRQFGEITAVSPALAALQAEQFGEDFALRLATSVPSADIERAVRAAGDVAEVQVGDFTPAVAPLRRSEPQTLPGPKAHPDAGSADPATPTTRDGQVRPTQHVRIELHRLDSLMNLIGELVITRGRLTQLSTVHDDPALAEVVTQASRLIGDLRDEIMTSRMVPVWQVFDRFPRMVRDSARAVGKQIDFAIEGKNIELDRSMLDEIGEPVLHLLRNAIDHGLEAAAARAAAGKEPSGRLVLSALRDRSAVVIRVSDDGRGIDRDKVLARAKADGLVDPARTDLTDEELTRLIARPGFSTAEQVTGLSGRGVGIDVVMNRVRSLGGSVDIRSQPGQGTTVALRLPLTLAIVRSLLARADAEVYAIPLTHVSETVELAPDALRTVRGREVAVLREDVLPLLRLRELVGLAPARDARLAQVVIVEAGNKRAALVVDELTTQLEIVVKQFDAARGGLGLFGGATILGDGAPALILDVSSLL
ncbi:MAG: chemotaxis protein CheA, partial [Gemmatimonadota bacterium]|nr:chemotaxis protein CheA [Gemmatimonadota bacterium]